MSLGCQIVTNDDEWTIVIARGAMILQTVPKTPILPVPVQKRILRAFSISEDDFLAQLAKMPSA